MLYGLRRKGLDRGGAALGLVVATTLAIASHAFFACLATFFFTSSRATKFRSHRKRKIESDFKGGMFNPGSNLRSLVNYVMCSRRRQAKLVAGAVQWWHGNAAGAAVFVGLW